MARIINLKDELSRPVEHYDMRKHWITQSMLQKALRCDRAFILTVHGWSHPKTTERTLFGTIHHEILDKGGSLCSKPPAKSLIDRWIIEVCTTMAKEIEIIDLQKLEQIKALVAITDYRYFKYYQSDFEKKKFTAFERTVTRVIDGFTLVGKLDAQFVAAGKPWIKENKSYGDIGEDTIQLRLATDFQNHFYDLLDGQKASGTLFDVTRRWARPPKANESLQEYTERIDSEIQNRPEHFFHRYEIVYSAEDRFEFLTELPLKLRRTHDLLRIDGRKICRNECMCTEGKYPCEFLNACSSGTMNGYIQRAKMFTELPAPYQIDIPTATPRRIISRPMVTTNKPRPRIVKPGTVLTV